MYSGWCSVHTLLYRIRVSNWQLRKCAWRAGAALKPVGGCTDPWETAKALGTPRGYCWDHWRRSATPGTLKELVFGFLVHDKEQRCRVQLSPYLWVLESCRPLHHWTQEVAVGGWP
ncbi:hypothetical protein Pcinc_037816 [Petrolisthes cinctipes]|uniref:Uncharacterized protein n=1 Tax=Petrolisthes cinctipes TaxID=88211 RepID=A0AAE1BVR3_PETCI|nr:hypothetical protein Pcinc_037816 [Petrolisthes cinctipes]